MSEAANVSNDVEKTVRDRIEELIHDEDQIHGITISRKQDETVYAVMVRSSTWDRIDDDVTYDVPVLDMRTVVIDFDVDTVKISDNGMWIPQEKALSEELISVFARTTSDLAGAIDPDAEPAISSAVPGLDPDLVLERETEDSDENLRSEQYVDRMERETGIDPNREWGYNAGPPPEVHEVIEKLEEAGLPTDRFIRLNWGKKSPIERMNGDLSNGRSVDELLGNYGICPEAEDSGLLLVDVDYPEKLPDVDLPETWAVSSPHGDDTQRHLWFRCDEKDRLFDELGSWAVQSAEWGDMWIGDRYGVGPGSQTSEYACNEGEYESDEAGGCEACEDPERGFYRTVEDAPIATVDADTLLELLEKSDGYNLRTGPAEVKTPEEIEEEDDLEDGEGRCEACDEIRDEEDLRTTMIGGEKRHFCRGGCD